MVAEITNSIPHYVTFSVLVVLKAAEFGVNCCPYLGNSGKSRGLLVTMSINKFTAA